MNELKLVDTPDGLLVARMNYWKYANLMTFSRLSKLWSFLSRKNWPVIAPQKKIK